MDYTELTVSDAPLVVNMIRGLRKISADHEINTKGQQSYILRKIKPEVLAVVAAALENPLTLNDVLAGKVLTAEELLKETPVEVQ